MIATANNSLCGFTKRDASGKKAAPLRRNTESANYNHAIRGVDIKTFCEVVNDNVSTFRADDGVSAACK